MTPDAPVPVRVAAPPPLAPAPLPLLSPLLGCPSDALSALRSKAVAVVGCGSVGGRTAVQLARLGIGELLLIDPKKTKSTSIATHDIGPGDLDQPKAVVTARRCRAIHPAGRFRSLVAPVESVDLAALARIDAFVMSPDLLSAELATGQRGLWLGRPVLHASVHGPTLTAHVRTFLNAKDTGACPACGFGPAEWELMTRQVRFSCEGPQSGRAAVPPAAPATNSVSPLCSLAADLAVIQLLRLLLPARAPVDDSMLEFCGFTHRTVASPLPRHSRCRLDHTRFGRASVPDPAGRLSLGRWFELATGAPPGSDASFELPGFAWVEFAACQCPHPLAVRRFVDVQRLSLDQCPSCSAPRIPMDFHVLRRVGRDVLGDALDIPLRSLGVRRIDALVVRHANGGVLARAEANPSPLPSLPDRPDPAVGQPLSNPASSQP